MKTLHLRIKDKHSKTLNQMSRDTNLVWNYCNELCYKHLQKTGKFFSSYDLQKYTAGASKEGLTINSSTVQMVGAELVTRRKQFRKLRLKYRISKEGSRKSLGWIPFRNDALVYKSGQVKYNGIHFSLWDSYGLSKYEFKSGNFSQDSRGRWYINICVDTKSQEIKPITNGVGIDLGLKDFATFSNGTKIESQKIYRNSEQKLAMAQKSNKKSRVKAIHAKIKNKRKDFHHKLSTKLVNQFEYIAVGNVSSSALAKTNLAKSVLDSGWSSFRNMLKYKSIVTGVLFEEVDEKFSSQICSNCGSLPSSRPRGIADLGIRTWICSDCSYTHDRDINAARNILMKSKFRIGHNTLAEGNT